MESKGEQEQTRVRIPVAVMPDGSVMHGIGGTHGSDEDRLAWLESHLEDYFVTKAKIVWIDAKVPVPEVGEVEGEAVD